MQPLAANGTYRVQAGAATAWRLRLSKFVRKCLELEARLKSSFQEPLLPGTEKFTLANRLHTDIILSGRILPPGWTARNTNELPPLQHAQEWIQAARELEKEDDLAQVVIRRTHQQNATRRLERQHTPTFHKTGQQVTHTSRLLSRKL